MRRPKSTCHAGACGCCRRVVYDIDSGGPDQTTWITVFEGSARFAGGGIDTLVSAGDVLVLSGGDTLLAAVERATPDEFVRWCRSHDYDEKRLATPHHISHLSYRVRRPLARIFGYVGWIGPGSRARP